MTVPLPPVVQPASLPQASDAPLRWWIDVGAVLAIPEGSLVYESRSTGLDLVVGKELAPHWSVYGAYRHVVITTGREWENEKYGMQSVDVAGGLRYSHGLVQNLRAFGDADLGLARLKLQLEDFASSDGYPIDGLGLRARAGLLASLGPFAFEAALGYSWSSIVVAGKNVGPSFGRDRFTDAWLTVNVSGQVAF